MVGVVDQRLLLADDVLDHLFVSYLNLSPTKSLFNPAAKIPSSYLLINLLLSSL